MRNKKIIYLLIISVKSVKYFLKKFGAKYYVYTPGRVASASVYHSINNYRRVIHTHCLGRIFDKNLKHDYMCHFNDGYKPQYRLNYTLLMKFVDFINFHLPFKKKIVILFRDPISRDISGFFKDLNKIHTSKLVQNSDIEDLIDLFFKAINRDYSLTWFDKEFFKSTKLNIYDYEFIHDKGFIVFKKGKKEFMLLKTEFLSICEDDLASFLEIKNFKLESKNVSKREYGSLYSKFINTINFPESTLKDVYSSPIVKHLYSAAEISQFVSDWSKNDNIA